MRSTYTIAPALLLLAGCLSTPSPSASPDVDAPPASPDAEVGPPPDAEPLPPDASDDPCAGGGCDQLLAVAMSGWSGAAGGGWIVLRHDGSGGWDEVAESSGPDWDIYDVEWGDCCGPSGPDGVPDLLGAAWIGPHVSVLSTVDVLRAGIPHLVETGLDGDGEAQALWLDLDGDLDVDVLTGRDSLRAYLRDGNAWTPTPLAPGWTDHRLALGNWDDDVAVEVAAAGGAGVHVLELGAWTTPEDLDTRIASDVAWCDVAGSAHPELFAQRLDTTGGVSNPIDVYPNRGVGGADGWLDAPVQVAAVTGRTTMQGACVDLDGNGGLDFLYLSYDGITVRPHGVAGVSVVWAPVDFIVEDFEPVLVDGVVTGILVVMNTPAKQGYDARVIWLPNQSAAGVFGLGAAEPIYQADVAGHGLAWIEVPAGVLP